MPVVRYRQQVNPAAAPNARRSPQPTTLLDTPRITVRPTAESTGAGIGEGLRALGSDLHGVALEYQRREKSKADQVAVMKADSDVASRVLDYLDHPERGVLNTVRGMDASRLTSESMEKFQKWQGDARETLGNEEQKAVFDLRMASRLEQFGARVYRHVASEQRKTDDTETARSIEIAQTEAAANAWDAKAVGAQADWIRELVGGYAERSGMGPAETQAATESAVSKLYVGVIDRLLAQGDDVRAKLYYSALEDQIVGTERAKIERALEVGTQRGEAQRTADRILRSGYAEDEAIAEARKITDPEIRDDVEGRVKADYQRRKQAEREDREEKSRIAAQAIADQKVAREQQLKGLANIIDAKKSTDAIPPNIWADLTVSERSALDAYANRLEKEGKVETDFQTYYMLMDQASRTPAQFEDLNLTLYLHKLAPTEFKQLTEVQASIRAGDRKKAETQLDDFRTENQIINDTLGTMDIDPGAKENRATVARVHRMVGEQAARLQGITGKKATNEDIQQIVDDIVSTSYTVDGWIWDTEKPLITATIGDVPAKDKLQIEAALRESGRAVTDEAIVDLYIRTQQRLKKRKPE